MQLIPNEYTFAEFDIPQTSIHDIHYLKDIKKMYIYPNI